MSARLKNGGCLRFGVDRPRQHSPRADDSLPVTAGGLVPYFY